MGLETVGEAQHPNDAAEAWKAMVASLSQADSGLASMEVPPELMGAETNETTEAEEVEEELVAEDEPVIEDGAAENEAAESEADVEEERSEETAEKTLRDAIMVKKYDTWRPKRVYDWKKSERGNWPLNSRVPRSEYEWTNPQDDLAFLNKVRLEKSLNELEDFRSALKRSPEEYWEGLKILYSASDKVDLGPLPDVKEMEKLAQGYFEKNGYGADQKERVDAAVKTELTRMAREKAAELKALQERNVGKNKEELESLPENFDQEWLKKGEGDMERILGAYYDDDESYDYQAKKGGKLTDDEIVGWAMANLPDEPGKMDPVEVAQNYVGRFTGETALGYYNRLNNYRGPSGEPADPERQVMRDWQLEQDRINERQVADPAEIDKINKVSQAVENLKVADGLLERVDLKPETRASIEDSRAKIEAFLSRNQGRWIKMKIKMAKAA